MHAFSGHLIDPSNLPPLSNWSVRPRNGGYLEIDVHSKPCHCDELPPTHLGEHDLWDSSRFPDVSFDTLGILWEES